VSVVTARQLTRRFGDFVAVDRFDLDVEPGEVVGLLGANGAGKTTLIKMVLGLLTPTRGTIRLFGEPHGREQRRRIGYVPQNLGLYTDLTVRENLAFRAQVFGVRVVDVDLPAVTRSEHPDDLTLVGRLPLGTQRRAAFEAATQHRPELLVLDEPTSGVSPLARSRLWDLIHEQADDGVAVLVSTHYMDEAEQADRLLVMADGRLVAQGTTADVVAGRTTVEVSADRWADAFAVLDHDERRLRLAGRSVRVLGERPEDVLAELTAAGITARTAASPATLEEVLIELDRRSAPGTGAVA